MTPLRLKLLHVAAWVRTTGGVETLLRRHAQRDAAAGFDAHQIALFDRGTPAEGGYTPHAFGWRSTPGAMRRALRPAFARHSGSVVLWHNGWGLPWFADLDGSARRVVCLWDSVAHFGPWLAQARPLVDGVTCMSDAAAQDVRRLLPGLAPERIAVLPMPIAPPAAEERAGVVEGTIVIGGAGRLVRAQKRWDRLPAFLAELRRLNLRYRMEIVSDGPLRPWLQDKLAGDPAVRFLGWQSAADYGRRIAGWDAAIFFSDHEGGPIVLLEAMAAGVLPFYPTIGGSVGDDYAPRIDPRCHYPAGEPVLAARAVAGVFAEAPGVLEKLRERARTLAATHQGDAYEVAGGDFVRRIASLPRISRPPDDGRPPRWTDRLPLGLITRVLPAELWR